MIRDFNSYMINFISLVNIDDGKFFFFIFLGRPYLNVEF